MHKYYKTCSPDGYIQYIGVDVGVTEINENEYNELLVIIEDKPSDLQGKFYRLNATSLEWELFDIPAAPDEPTRYTQKVLETMTNAELEQILYGYGIAASMNKANMIRRILDAQGGETE